MYNVVSYVNSMFLFIAERKEVLLVTGRDNSPRIDPNVEISFDIGKQVEIVDFFGQPKKCKAGRNYPTGLQNAMGGLLNNQLVICGGLRSIGTASVTNQCQRLGNSGQWSLFGGGLKVWRIGASSTTVTIQGEDFLWITGGIDGSLLGPGQIQDGRLKSTELVSSSGSVTSGTNLPEVRLNHCMIVINNHVMVIGGYQDWRVTSDFGRSVVIFDSEDFSHENGPALIKKRHSHACSTMVSPAHGGRMVAVVAGGYEDGSDTAEILDYTMSRSTWQLSEYYL